VERGDAEKSARGREEDEAPTDSKKRGGRSRTKSRSRSRGRRERTPPRRRRSPSRSRSRGRGRERGRDRDDDRNGRGRDRDGRSGDGDRDRGGRGRDRSRDREGSRDRGASRRAEERNGGRGKENVDSKGAAEGKKGDAPPPAKDPAAPKPNILLGQEVTLTGRTGGVYIPPFKLAAMRAQLEQDKEKNSKELQRMTWEALRKSINGLINKVNVSNIANIIPELFQENLVRGRGLFVRAVMKAQMASPGFTHIYAA
jgi:pre-mRNA-splicing factor CWC22